MCARASDMNIGSKEQELRGLLEVLRIKAETHVLVSVKSSTTIILTSLHPQVWDHIATLLEGEEGTHTISEEYLREANEFIRLK